MKDETLMSRAKFNLKAAESNFNLRYDDDCYLNLTGYLLQQSVELAIKHCLEISGIKYPKTHNISELLALLPSEYDDAVDIILMYSDSLTYWEFKTRCIKNFRLSEKLLNNMFPIVKKFLDSLNESIDKYYSSSNIKEMNLFLI